MNTTFRCTIASASLLLSMVATATTPEGVLKVFERPQGSAGWGMLTINVAFWATMLAVAYLAWRCVETPARTSIVRYWRARASRIRAADSASVAA